MKNPCSIICLLCLLFAGCNSFLEKDPFEREKIDSEEKIAQVLVNAYPANHWAFMTEMASDEADQVVYTPNVLFAPQIDLFYWRDASPVYPDCAPVLWRSYYNAISHANLALESIKELGEPDYLLPYKGEALICRAFCHFILVNLFCKHYNADSSNTDLGIPYVREVSKNFNQKYDRETVSAVYRKIEDDILEGIALLDDHTLAVPTYRFNRKAAMAFASRFYLLKRDFAKVIEYSSEILTGDIYSSLRNWKEFAQMYYQEYNRILTYPCTDAPCNLMVGSFRSDWNTYGCIITPSLIVNNLTLQQTEGMHRNGLWGDSFEDIHLTGQIGAGTEFVVHKIGLHEGSYMLMPLFTTEEVLLNRAEAYVCLSREKGDSYLDLATADISTFLRSYSTQTSLTRQMVDDLYGPAMNYYTWDKPTPKKALDPALGLSGEAEAFIHGLLHLRRSVFIHEGFRWFDIKRYGIEIYRREIEDGRVIRQMDFLSRDDPRRAFQLPPYAIDAGMKPNPR